MYQECLCYVKASKEFNLNFEIEINFIFFVVYVNTFLYSTCNVYFSICFVSKKTINTYLKLEIRVACREFLAFKYVVIFFFRNKTDDHLYLYIRNLENSRLKSVFRYTIFICICVGR